MSNRSIEYTVDDMSIDCQFTYRELVAMRIAIGHTSPADMRRLMNCLWHKDVTKFLANRKPTHDNLMSPLSDKLQTICRAAAKNPNTVYINGKKFIVAN